MLIIVPAREGSKGLPGKNSRDFCGHALIDWSLSAALYLQEKIVGASVQVTTDCPTILALTAQKYGSRITARKRPAALASDTAAMADVILDAADFSGMGRAGRYVLLQPTSPLRCAVHIEEAIALLKEKKADSVVSVCPAEHSPLWANTLNETQSMNVFIPDELKNLRSQDLPEYYRLNG
ncbi:MAG: acylneuraminate cytidylyltransferase family protein, partial [Paracoccaceae bacterium]|nr:acylneuraminate cytidylyltransferase family protein [Paracoccaceae bacterium]